MTKRVFVLGFENLGMFGMASRAEGDLEFQFQNSDTSCNLDDAHGIMIRQGAYEHFQSGHKYGVGNFVHVLFNNDLLLHLEKQLGNALSNGSWVCFVVDEIHDAVRSGSADTDISSTDLAKRKLNALGVRERLVRSGNPYLQLKSDEFKEYFHKHGVGKTIFRLPPKRSGFSELIVSADQAVYGFEYQNNVFFLPLVPSPSLTNRPSEILEVLKQLVNSIEDYRLRSCQEITGRIIGIGI